VHCRPRPGSAALIGVAFAEGWPDLRSSGRRAHLGCAFCARELAGKPKRESLRRRRM